MVWLAAFLFVCIVMLNILGVIVALIGWQGIAISIFGLILGLFFLAQVATHGLGETIWGIFVFCVLMAGVAYITPNKRRPSSGS